MLGKIVVSSFILFTGTRHIFTGIDSTGFKLTHMHQNIIIPIKQDFERNMLNYLLEQMF